MPRSRFKPLTLGSLPRVMVAILAMDPVDVDMIATAIRNDDPLMKHLTAQFVERNLSHGAPTGSALAGIFDAILQMPKDVRGTFAVMFDGVLDDLRRQDAFGTEGQLDPRGDPRG